MVRPRVARGMSARQVVHRSCINVPGLECGAFFARSGHHGYERALRMDRGPETTTSLASPPTSSPAIGLTGREHRMPVLLAPTLLDAQQHAVAVDVGDLQVRNFGHAKAGTAGHAQCG